MHILDARIWYTHTCQVSYAILGQLDECFTRDVYLLDMHSNTPVIGEHVSYRNMQYVCLVTYPDMRIVPLK